MPRRRDAADHRCASSSRATPSRPSSGVIYITLIRSRDRVISRLISSWESVTRTLSSRARCRRRFRETRGDRIALSRGTGTPVGRYTWWYVSPKIPAGPESAKREGRAQVIAIHLPPGTYLGSKPSFGADETVTQTKGRDGSWRANRDTRRTRIAGPSRKGNALPASCRGCVKFSAQHRARCEIQSCNWFYHAWLLDISRYSIMKK